MDDVQRNIEVVRRLEAAFNQRDYSQLGELLASRFAGHNPAANEVTVDGLTSNNEDWHAAFPGKWTDVTDAFGEGDKVVARIRDRGTNIGGVLWFGIPANGQKMDMQWLQITRHDPDGKIVEMWALAEVPKLLTQLGAVLSWEAK